MQNHENGRVPWDNLILGIIKSNAPSHPIHLCKINAIQPKRDRKWNSDTATEAGRSGAKGREACVTWGRGDEAEAAERNDVETCWSSQAKGLAGREI
jgi:hypothetical protein